MMQSIFKKLRLFRKKDDGNITVEFVVMVPMFLTFMLGAVEIGITTIRASILERALDETVRHVRLNTGTAPTHADLKTMICQFNVVPECESNLRLEMLVRDVRNWEDLPATYACTDASTAILPMSEYSFGMDNDLVVLRACAKYDPIFPNAIFGASLSTDAAGDASLTAMSAFVQEPR